MAYRPLYIPAKCALFPYSLAYAELYLIIATFVRRFDMEIYETTVENIRTAREFGVAYPKDGNFSVRAIITNVVTE